MKTETHYVNPDLQDARESASFLYGEMQRLQALNTELLDTLHSINTKCYSLAHAQQMARVALYEAQTASSQP